MLHSIDGMVICFSQFLTDLTAIVTNIKQYVYELINISIHLPKNNVVYRSMSSILLSTHRTYDDLKQIESIILSVIRSRRSQKKQAQFNSISYKFARNRSQSQQTELYHSPRQRYKSKRNKFRFSSQQKRLTQTVKIGSTSKILVKQDLQKINSFKKQPQPNISNHNINDIVQQSNQLVTCMQGLQKGSQRKQKLSQIHLKIQQKLKKLIQNNKQTLSSFSLRNDTCLQLINLTKSQLNSIL